MSGWLVETLVATTLLMALVLLVRPAVRRGFGAGAAYALWLVPALRLVLPPLSVPETAGLVPAVPVDIVFATAATAPGYGEWLLWLWALGAALFAAWHIIAYRRFLARAGRADKADGSGILVSDAVEGPAAVGLLHRLILVPRDFATRFDASERALAIRHERIHHARGDLWANAAALGMLSLHWFNPIAHRAYRAFREDQELSCDAAVIAGASGDEREAYGRAMVKSAWGAAPFMSCPMTRNTNLKRRLKMVKTHKISRLGKLGGMLSVSAMAIAGLTLTATGSIAAEPTENVIIKRVHGKGAGTAAANSEIEARCGNDPQKFETEAVSERDGKPVKTRLVLCSKGGGGSAGDRAAALEKARARIAGSTDLDPANRAKVLSALDNAIAQLKASN